MPDAVVAQFEKDTGIHGHLRGARRRGDGHQPAHPHQGRAPRRRRVRRGQHLRLARAQGRRVRGLRLERARGRRRRDLRGRRAQRRSPPSTTPTCASTTTSATSRTTTSPCRRRFDDLLKPEYKGLLSVTNPATSCPGLAFLLATIAAKGDGWQDYWTELAANDLRVTASWSDTYYTDFSAPNYGGDYPLVLSYASSPPFEVIDGKPTTAALLDTCFRQVEYVGVLTGAKHPAAAQKVVDWMLSDDFQSALPENMYVYPVSSSVDRARRLGEVRSALANARGRFPRATSTQTARPGSSSGRRWFSPDADAAATTSPPPRVGGGRRRAHRVPRGVLRVAAVDGARARPRGHGNGRGAAKSSRAPVCRARSGTR